MKRLYSSLLGVCVVLLLTLTASGADTVAVTLDGAPLDIMAYISEDGRTMVPLRDLAQALGFSVTWDQQTRTAAITSGGEPEAQPSPLVVIDPGHGGSANGAVYDGVLEKELNLSIAVQAARLLEEAGLTVRMTRTGDQDVGLYDRIDLANGQGADLFVSVHCNASVEHDDALGVYTCAYSQGTEGWQLAQILRETMLDATGAADFGMEERPNLAVLRTAQVPAALVECGFMSTPSELALLTQPEYQDKLARGIADGILACLAQ